MYSSQDTTNKYQISRGLWEIFLMCPKVSPVSLKFPRKANRRHPYNIDSTTATFGYVGLSTPTQFGRILQNLINAAKLSQISILLHNYFYTLNCTNLSVSTAVKNSLFVLYIYTQFGCGYCETLWVLLRICGQSWDSGYTVG